MAAGAAQSILIDALPYIDEPLTDEMRFQVNAMIEEEMGKFPPTDYLDHLPLPKSNVSPLIEQEYERIKRGIPLQGLDVKRYEIPQPSAAHRSDVAKWKEAVDNANTQLEHQRLRQENVDLLNQYAKPTWLNYNAFLESQQKPLDATKTQLKARIDDVNRSRKAQQLGHFQQFSTLQGMWTHLLAKNVDLQMECQKMERRVKRMRK